MRKRKQNTRPKNNKRDPEGKPRSLWRRLGAGLIAGAADDDPSGIATYSQVGAAFGMATLWTMLFTLPLMFAMQSVSAHIGRVTGHGLAANIRRNFPGWFTVAVAALLFVANTINLAADIGAMGSALKLLIGGPAQLYAVIFAVASVVLQVFLPFPRYSPLLKLLTLSLLAYIATAFVIPVPWSEVAHAVVLPKLQTNADYIVAIVAVFGTTISPYLFFWQSSQEVEEQRAAPGVEALKNAPHQAKSAFERISLDTGVGMVYSNVVAFFIMLTAAVVLHAHGVTEIQTASHAAEALKPLAGQFAFALFAAGIIGTGMLAVPVLAGSAAYALSETFRWRIGLNRKPGDAKMFYGVIVLAAGLGAALNFTPIDPIKALYWSAVINGVIAIPIMAVILTMAAKRQVMGKFVVSPWLRGLGWCATAAMAAAVVAMALTWDQ